MSVLDTSVPVSPHAVHDSNEKSSDKKEKKKKKKEEEEEGCPSVSLLLLKIKLLLEPRHLQEPVWGVLLLLLFFCVFAGFTCRSWCRLKNVGGVSSLVWTLAWFHSRAVFFFTVQKKNSISKDQSLWFIKYKHTTSSVNANLREIQTKSTTLSQSRIFI